MPVKGEDRPLFLNRNLHDLSVRDACVLHADDPDVKSLVSKEAVRFFKGKFSLASSLISPPWVNS